MALKFRADAIINGYLCEFHVYVGKKDNVREVGLGESVELTRALVGNNYRIYCDNFFTLVQLFRDLLNDCVYVTVNAKTRLL